MANDPITTPAGNAESTLSGADLAKLKSRLRAQAERSVIENHRDEYNAEAERLFAEHGLEFSRRLTESEKAKRQMDELLKKFPELAPGATAPDGIKVEEGATEEPMVFSSEERPF